MAWSTPIDLRNSRLLADAVPMTRAPAAFAICTAAEPTPPAAPWISTVWPRSMRPASCNARYAVSPAIGTPAACSNVSDFGFGAAPRARRAVRRSAGERHAARLLDRKRFRLAAERGRRDHREFRVAATVACEAEH